MDRKHPSTHRSMTKRLTLSVSFLAMLFMLIVTAGVVMVHAYDAKQARLTALDDALQDVNASFAATIDVAKTDLDALADHDAIAAYLTHVGEGNTPVTDPAAPDGELFTDAVDALRAFRADPAYDRLKLITFASCAGSGDGCWIDDDGAVSDASFSLAGEPWFSSGHGTFYVSPAHRANDAPSAAVSFVRPIMDDGAPFALLVIDVTLDDLVGLIDEALPDRYRHVMHQSTGDDLRVLAYPDGTPGMHTPDELSDDVRAAISHEAATVTYESWFGQAGYVNQVLIADTPFAVTVMDTPTSFLPPIIIAGGAMALAVLVTLCFGLFVFLIMRKNLHPLSTLEDIGDKLRDDTYESTDVGPPKNELTMLAADIHGAAREITERLHALDTSYRYDAVTGLKMVHAAMDEIDRAIHGNDGKTSVCLVEVDNIKSINVTKGRNTGDDILRGVAERLRDINREAMIYAAGGNQFMYVCTKMTSFEAIEMRARQVMDAFMKPIRTGQLPVEAKTNMGIAVAPNDGDDLETLLRKCNVALYEARKKGRGGLVFYNDRLDAALNERVKMGELLTTALENDELYLKFQPLVDNKAEIYGFEALVRWLSPELGEISPESFIADAEESHLILPIGTWVLEQACLAQTEFKRRLGKDVVMSVNVSPVQMVHRDFPDILSRVVKDTGIDPACLTLEITENVFVESEVYLEEAINRLHSLGGELALDDFGTGYASLTYLQRIPFDKLKIDKSFVDGIFQSKKEHNIIATIVDLVHDLDMSVIAEGVEDRRQYEYLRQITTDVFQGYFFSEPLVLPDALDFIKSFDAMPRSKRIDRLTAIKQEKDGDSS